MHPTDVAQIPVVKASARLDPNPTRVLARTFIPGEWAMVRGESRLETVLARIHQLSQHDGQTVLERLRRDFSGRHKDLESIWRHNFDLIADSLDAVVTDRDQQLLIGAFFTQEYAVEGAALCNPSAVRAPDGSGRLILAMRAIGEGHISSIEFRQAEIDDDGTVRFTPTSGLVATGRRETPPYDREMFRFKLLEVGADEPIIDRIIGHLDPFFGKADLDAAMAAFGQSEASPAAAHETLRLVDWLASSNYVVSFGPDTTLDERVLFPVGPVESHGMEDARFVRFVDDDGAVTYYATYTAFDGFNILPQLIETRDFVSFRVATLNGSYAQNKGIALFPRRIGGRYAALARHDRESISYMTSDEVRFWNETKPLYSPTEPWELIQIGNCGPPIETEAGWLVLTHGVGPMRRYSLGALLLDRDDPERVIGRLRDPLLVPSADGRDGYVPNVVYSCGGVVQDGWLVLPYGLADRSVAVATVALDDLLAALGAG